MSDRLFPAIAASAVRPVVLVSPYDGAELLLSARGVAAGDFAWWLGESGVAFGGGLPSSIV